MARFGQGFIQALTNPSYQQGLFTAAQGVGAAPGVAAAEKKQSTAMQLVNDALASNDPQQLLQAAQAIRTIDPATATKLAGLAQQATQAQKDLVLKQDEARASRGVQGGLAAISQGAARGVPLEQLNEGVRSVIAQGGTQADILDAYNKGKQKPNAQAVNLSKGSVLVDPETREIIVSNVQEDKATQEVPTALHGKYTPKSIQSFATTNDYSKLVPITEPTKQGELDGTVQKELLRVGEQGTKAAVNLNVNRNLQASIAANPNRSTGLISELRTSVLNLAGKQDLEEADKIAFIRQRNAEIVTGLPPGVASDRDIELFSQGFPDASASTETILRYLQAEERILAARADQALLFDDFLAAQRDTGNKPSTIGFVRKQNAYGKSLSTLETRIASIKANAQQTGEDPSEAINKELNYFKEVYNFVPTYYR